MSEPPADDDPWCLYEIRDLDEALDWLVENVHWLAIRVPRPPRFPQYQVVLHHQPTDASRAPVHFLADEFSTVVDDALQWVISERARLGLRGS